MQEGFGHIELAKVAGRRKRKNFIWNCYELGLYDFKKSSREGIAKNVGYCVRKTSC